MRKNLRQVADTVHQTVYQSELESNMISTAYFYRLHDIYQSSTVYLAFPSNRSKRYEHSLGTMEIAGEMFYSAITNALPPNPDDVGSNDVLDSFFDEAEKYFHQVVTNLQALSNDTISYFKNSRAAVAECLRLGPKSRQEREKEAFKIEENAYRIYYTVSDAALDHYMPPFSKDLNKRRFLYQCLLEAVRIVALFHDVGHPPYSHIMEDVLNKLYESCNREEGLNSRQDELKLSLMPFKSQNDEIRCLISSSESAKGELHERVGLKMLAGAFEDVFSCQFGKQLRGDDANLSRDQKEIFAIYYVTVAEFCFAILREQTPFFTSLHRIVDGCIDADRMDYIVRDSHNAGVDWGTIPYKRLIDSCKIIKSTVDGTERYFFAFPEKMTEHINDLLITRYKIYSRINYHHRSYKTALILKLLVQYLADDYLKKEGNKRNELCPGIADLWNCLTNTLTSGDLYIIQWNDSTLISHLYRTLTDIKREPNCKHYGIDADLFTKISNMLEEFLLNHKHFYAVFKRQSDLSSIIEGVFASLRDSIQKVKDYEEKKLREAKTESEYDGADDSLKRLQTEKIEGIIQSADTDAFARIIPVDIRNIIKDVLDDQKKKGKIREYLFDENKKRSNTGLPNREDGSDMIYLYDPTTNKAKPYNTAKLLLELVQLQKFCLQFIAYIDPIDELNSEAVIDEIRREICNRLISESEQQMKELFSCLRT